MTKKTTKKPAPTARRKATVKPRRAPAKKASPRVKNAAAPATASKPQAAASSPKPQTPPTSPDPQLLAENMTKAAELWQLIMQTGAAKSLATPPTLGHSDPIRMAESMLEAAKNITIDPKKMADAQLGLMNEHLKLWQWWTGKMLGREDGAYVEPSPKDRRFADNTWTSGIADFIKQNYLVNSRWLENFVDEFTGMDEHSKRKMKFFTRQFIDATSPSNNAFTNPQVVSTMIETNGESIVRGLTHLLSDLEKEGDTFRISMTDEKAFTLGKNIAASPGQVVFENDLMQLIQFEATTDQVHEVPILLTPAWINKYYILDLTPERSGVRALTDMGYTVFVISWVNPTAEHGRKGFEDYLSEGPLAALDVIENITKSKKTALIGYCLGGTLTAIMLAYLRANGDDSRIASASYLTTLVDFKEAGDISVFIDDSQLDALEGRMEKRGYLDASEMATTFNMLRSNDLIWSFVVNNYLLGKPLMPFDLLYWNSDSTRMPSAMHAFYLRNMYQQNNLIKPGGITILDVPINLTKIKTPTYVLATREDHIAPWMSCYTATQTYDGKCTFTLADSGHIAGVINPPAKGKYCYWTNNKLPPTAEEWLDGAKEHPGSWWPHWEQWQRGMMGKKVPARKTGNTKYKPIEPAPGRYAKVKT